MRFRPVARHSKAGVRSEKSAIVDRSARSPRSFFFDLAPRGAQAGDSSNRNRRKQYLFFPMNHARRACGPNASPREARNLLHRSRDGCGRSRASGPVPLGARNFSEISPWRAGASPPRRPAFLANARRASQAPAQITQRKPRPKGARPTPPHAEGGAARHSKRACLPQYFDPRAGGNLVQTTLVV